MTVDSVISTVTRRASTCERVIASARSSTSRSSVSSPGATLSQRPRLPASGCASGQRPADLQRLGPTRWRRPRRSVRSPPPRSGTRPARAARARGAASGRAPRRPGSCRRPARPPAGSTTTNSPRSRGLLELEGERIGDRGCGGAGRARRARSARSSALGRVHRQVGVAKQLLGRRGVGAGDGDADARVHGRLVARGQRDRRVDERRSGARPRASRPAASVSRSRTANSSPPRRAGVSCGRTAPWIRSATCTSSSSPAACPQLSFTTLNRSRSRNRTACVRPIAAPSSVSPRRSANSNRFGSRVSASVYAWWCSSSFSSVTWASERSRRPFSSSTLAWPRERLEQAEVVLGERADVPDPVTDEQKPEHPLLVVQRARRSRRRGRATPASRPAGAAARRGQ